MLTHLVSKLLSFQFSSVEKCTERAYHFETAQSFSNNIIIPEQSGFLPKQGATHQLVRLVKLIHNGSYNKYQTVGILLSVTRAFDYVLSGTLATSTWQFVCIWQMLTSTSFSLIHNTNLLLSVTPTIFPHSEVFPWEFHRNLNWDQRISIFI